MTVLISEEKIKPEDIKLTREEARNGWTKETLAAYRNERFEQKQAYVGIEKKVRNVKMQNVQTFNPHNWIR